MTTRRPRRVWLVLPALLLASSAFAAGPDLALIAARVDAGQFAAAESAIAASLAQEGLPAVTRDALEFQRERMRRILLDFPLDADAVKTRLRSEIPDLTDAEFANWDAHGLFESQIIDGERRYFSRAAANLFRLSREALARRRQQTPLVDGPMEHLNPYHREVLDAAAAAHTTSAAPRHVRVKQSLTVKADAVPAGETVRAWIPYPRAIAGQQENLRFLRSEPAKRTIAPESALQRTVYLEKPAVAGRPTVFSIQYELTVYGRHFDVDADKVVPATITPELAPYVAERAPHMVFSEAMRLFSRQIVGEEKNPWRIAQRLFAAVDQVPWAGAREYSTITNIGDYALHAGHADCGQQTLLLITLLRLNGIPTRWQSGMVYSDGAFTNLHDWGQLYMAPYGWMPVDVTTGRLDSPDPVLAGFYLGGLDAYRLAFNDDWGRQFTPAKTHFRSDTVDSQRGEAEWRGGNLYYDQFDYDFEAQVGSARAMR
ncbi:MAG: transglutaminase-like domain-containing protein [Rudaea sp.]